MWNTCGFVLPCLLKNFGPSFTVKRRNGSVYISIKVSNFGYKKLEDYTQPVNDLVGSKSTTFSMSIISSMMRSSLTRCFWHQVKGHFADCLFVCLSFLLGFNQYESVVVYYTSLFFFFFNKWQQIRRVVNF